MNSREDISKWHKQHPYGARDEQYMDAVLAQVKRRWKEYPTERLGQLVENLAGGDPFHTLDENWFDK